MEIAKMRVKNKYFSITPDVVEKRKYYEKQTN